MHSTISIISFFLCATLSSLFGQDLMICDPLKSDWWNEPYNPIEHTDSSSVTDLPFISVRGNSFISEAGDTIIFKGLSISDPDKIEKNGKWGREHFEVINNWGANLVRIPVHPLALRQRGFKNYMVLLDEAVQWCTELGMYVVIDWHTIGNLHMEMFQADMYETSQKETLYFWKSIASHFKGHPTVAFYEIFNEPTRYNGTLGKCTWAEWKSIVEDIIDVIYAHDKQVIPLVAGFNWAYDLQEAAIDPIDRPGIGYVTHPYPGKCEHPREPHWEEHFGSFSQNHPVIATELGYYFEGEAHLIEDGTYRQSIMDYLDSKGISWCAWVFDPNWVPQLIKNYNYDPTHAGSFFKAQMKKSGK